MAHDIFISYRRVDQELAKALVNGLTSRGVRVWWDGEIEGGEDWREAIAENLSVSDALVILFSEACNDSKQLKKEIALADTLDKIIVPVLIEDTKPRGHFLYEMAAINWLQIHPDPETKINSLVARLIEELEIGTGPSSQGFTAEPIQPDPQTDRPQISEPARDRQTLERKVQAKADAKEKKRQLRDFLPFKWYEVLIAGLAAVLMQMAVTEDLNDPDRIIPYWDPALGFFLVLGVIALLVFPIRYYVRRRRVGRAFRSFVASNLVIGGAFAAIASFHPDFYDEAVSQSENIWIMAIAMTIIVVVMTCIAFAIYGLLHFQRALRSFEKHVDKL